LGKVAGLGEGRGKGENCGIWENKRAMASIGGGRGRRNSYSPKKPPKSKGLSLKNPKK